jgi:gamma-glutamylputrescine oxidase
MDHLPSAVFWCRQKGTQQRKPAPSLDGDATADVVVVGGGVAGLHCAAALADKGADVILLEREFCGAGASGKTSGFVTPDSELELGDLIRNRGLEKAKELWEFALGGVRSIEADIRDHGIDCDFQVQDSLFIANGARRFEVVRGEHEGRRQLEYPSVLYDATSIRTVIGSDGYAGGVRYPGTFGMNSYLYCQAMKEVLAGKGVRVFERSPVTGITAGGVTCGTHAVAAPKTVACADRFLPEMGVLAGDIYHAQTFLSISKPLTDAQARMIFPEKRLMVWDTDLIYQYFRITGDNRLLLGAASMLYTYARKERADTRRVLRKMRSYLRAKFPSVPAEIESVWPGLIGVSKDFVPLAGRDEERPFLYFVGAAAGLPWAAALGRYIAEKIIDGRDDLDAEFTQRRKFPIGRGFQTLIGTPNAFALSHGVVKYVR